MSFRHHCHPLQIFVHLIKLYLLNNSYSFFVLPVLGNHHSAFCQIWLLYVPSAYKWNHTVFVFFSDCLISLMAQLVKNLPAVWETWIAKIPWRRERLPTPVLWPREFHGLYSPSGLKESTWLSDFHFQIYMVNGLPWWLSGKEPASQCRRHVLNPWVRKISWRKK